MAYMLRRAVADDVPTIAAINYDAYSIYGRPNRRERSEQMAAEHWPQYLLLERDGQVLGQAAVARHPLQVGRCRIMKAEVGHVAVRPECQGQGVGTYLMTQLVALLPGEGYHCSRLGGVMHFYRRFGYEPFMRRYVQIPLQPLDTPWQAITWRELLSAPPEAAARVRPYEAGRDGQAVGALLERFNAGRSGRMAHAGDDPPSAGAEPDPLCMVFDQDGVIRGFLQGFIGPVHSGQPPAYQITDFAADLDCPQATEALVKAFLTQAQAASVAPTTVSCRFAYDERLLEQLTAAGIQYDLQEMRGGFEGNMMMVVNLPGMLEATAPELSQRLQCAGVSPWEGTVRLVLPRQEAVLRIADGAVSVDAGSDADVTVDLSDAIMLKWVLGIAGAAEYRWLTERLDGPQQVTLDLLFPRLPTASGVWG